MVEFCCVLSKLDYLSRNKISKGQFSFHHFRITGNILHGEWSNLQNTQQNSTKFSTMLGKDVINAFIYNY